MAQKIRACGRRIPFIEDQIDHRQHRIEPFGPVFGLGDFKGNAGLGDLVARPHQPLRHRFRRVEKGAGDFPGR